MSGCIYADYNARTPLREEARAAMERAYAISGNASSVHGEGRKAKATLDSSRDYVAAAVGARATDLIFTSGATEANNQAIFGAVRAVKARTIFISAIEHESCWSAAHSACVDVQIIPALKNGLADLDWLEDRLKDWRSSEDGAPLICLMLVNNETGVVQDVRRAAGLAHTVGGYLMCDAVQALGRIGIDIEDLGADYMSLSAHKIGGAPGIGALVVRGSSPMTPFILGGGQERNRRAGTENLLGVVSFGAACAALSQDKTVRVRAIRDSFEAALISELRDAAFVGVESERVHNTSCVIVPNATAETVVVALDLNNVACSAGAACSSGKVQPSRALLAMGYSEGEARTALRFSFGWANQDGDGEAAAIALANVARRVQKQHAA